MSITELGLTSDRNAFKNLSVQRSEVALPVSMTANQKFHSSTTFEIAERANFIQAYCLATDYGDYFTYLDGKYHDFWRQINANNDYMFLEDDGGVTVLNHFQLSIAIKNRTVTIDLNCFNTSFPVTTIHDTGLIPITLVEYRLDR